MTLRSAFSPVCLCIVLIMNAGCAVITPRPVDDKTPSYVMVDGREARGLAANLSPRLQGLGSWVDLRPGLEDNLGYILKRPQDAVCVNRPGLVLTWGQLASSVAELIAMLPQLDRDPGLVADNFDWLKVSPGTLLTGYYEPWLEASLVQVGRYQYPLYGVPDDLKTINLSKFHHRWKGQSLVYRMGADGIEPYHDREAIDGQSVLAGKGYEIAWAKDPVDVFFLQIQGSGRLALPDGSAKHILYGGKNGHRYTSLGKLLIERGHVPREEMSMQRIRAFLNANPDMARDLMFENPSYVFFHLSDQGPFGSINSILTPRVSVAVDRSMIPLGSVLALKTALMDYERAQSESFFSLVLAQDTGGAIKGTRCDLFCGSGLKAENLAGHLQEQSELFMLVSKRVMRRMSKEQE